MKSIRVLILILLIVNLFRSPVIYGLNHDVGITDVRLQFDPTIKDTINLDVDIRNKGDYKETFVLKIKAFASGDGEGKISYWNFDEGSGVIAHDDSDNHYDGEIVDAKWTYGKYGKALSFDGDHDYVEAPFIPLYDRSFTVTMWINANSFPVQIQQIGQSGDAGLLKQHDTDSVDKGLHLVVRESLPYLGFWADDLEGKTILKPGNWYHLAFVYERTYNMKYIYVNGVLDDDGKSNDAYRGSSGKTYIGAKEGGHDSFHGIIDEVRIYDRALNQQEIRAFACTGEICEQSIIIESGSSKTVTVPWDISDVSPGSYIILAQVYGVSGDTSIADNDVESNWIELNDFDEDGIFNFADDDDDNDGVLDINDAFPFDQAESHDNDEDGVGDNTDVDDDNDGVLDDDDAFPFDSSEYLDTDGDNIGDMMDQDDDNDGVLDIDDSFPLDSTEWMDSDSDSIGDNKDLDDDNDGIEDTEDRWPYNSLEWIDSDNDGIGDNADPDDDNDGMPDTWEIQYNLDTTNPSDAYQDPDYDSITNIIEFQRQTNPRNMFSPFPTIQLSAILLVAAVVGYILNTRRGPPKEKPKVPVHFKITANPPELPADGMTTSQVNITLLNSDGMIITANKDIRVTVSTSKGSLIRTETQEAGSKSITLNIDEGSSTGEITLVTSDEPGVAILSVSAQGMKTNSINLVFKEKRRFCMHCGERMAYDAAICPNPECRKTPPSAPDVVACATCGEIIPNNAQYCSACGARQPKP